MVVKVTSFPFQNRQVLCYHVYCALNSWFEGLYDNVIRLQVDSIYVNNENFPGTYQSYQVYINEHF
jgi:hypothetical protein